MAIKVSKKRLGYRRRPVGKIEANKLNRLLLNKIKEIIVNDIVQRTIYGVGLIFWTGSFWETLSGELRYSISSLGISYIYLYLLPAILLGLQILRNNRILWGVIFGLFSTYWIAALYLLLSEAIERSGTHVKAIGWSLKDFILILVFFAVLGFVGWVIFLIKPKRIV